MKKWIVVGYILSLAVVGFLYGVQLAEDANAHVCGACSGSDCKVWDCEPTGVCCGMSFGTEWCYWVNWGQQTQLCCPCGEPN